MSLLGTILALILLFGSKIFIYKECINAYKVLLSFRVIVDLANFSNCLKIKNNLIILKPNTDI